MYHKQVHSTMYQVCKNHVSTTHQYVPTIVGKSPCGQVDCLEELDPNSKTEST
jgi:hypothetical protein